MKKRTKIVLLIATIIVLFIVFAIWHSNPTIPGVKTEPRLDDPDLVYASQYWSGLCSNENGEAGGCYTGMYLYSSGKLIKELVFVHSYSDQETTSVIERNFTISVVEQIINKIKDSGVMEKDCPSSKIMDAGWNFQVNIGGEKKSFYNSLSDCRNIFDEVDNLIDSIINYEE